LFSALQLKEEKKKYLGLRNLIAHSSSIVEVNKPLTHCQISARTYGIANLRFKGLRKKFLKNTNKRQTAAIDNLQPRTCKSANQPARKTG
tara:strand:- start:18315 stop:18584 length:270 start_codon:yes stop_codon:yes gene_type:complete